MNEFEASAIDQAIVIPDQCEGCAVQCELKLNLIDLLIAKHTIDQAGASLLGEEGEALDEMIDELNPEELADQIKQSVRRVASDNMEKIDKEVDEVQHEIDSNALSCSGVLRMSATRGDVRYTVNVCTSQKQYILDGRPKHLPVLIKAESANKT